MLADDIGPDPIKLTAKSMGLAEIEDRMSQETEDWSHLRGEWRIRRYIQRTIEKAHAFIG